MGGIKDILDSYRVSYSGGGTVQRVDVVDTSKGAHVSDPAKGILPWHDYVDKPLPDDALTQVIDARKAIRAIGPQFVPAKTAIPAPFIQAHCKGKSIYFKDEGNAPAVAKLIADIAKEADEIKHAMASATDEPKKIALHTEWLQTMAFKNLMNGREGPLSAVNTYDSAVVTWGMGWALKGRLGQVLEKIATLEGRAAPSDGDKHHVQKLFYLAGFLHDHGAYRVVDTVEKTVRETTGAAVGISSPNKPRNPLPDNPALRLLHDTEELHMAWVLLARDDLTRGTLLRAQLEVFKGATGKVPQAEKIQTAALYTFITHLQHWSSLTLDVVSWATGPEARPLLTEPMPSEKADAELATQAVNLFYNHRSPNLGDAVFTQTRDYWKQMTTTDAREEGVPAFKPEYAIMTAPPVRSVPPMHMAAVVDEAGTTYDLGPSDNFGPEKRKLPQGLGDPGSIRLLIPDSIFNTPPRTDEPEADAGEKAPSQNQQSAPLLWFLR